MTSTGEKIALMVSGTVCGVVAIFAIFAAPFWASRSFVNKNKDPVVNKTTVEVIEERYEACIKGQYAHEAHLCDSLKNQWHEAVEFRKANP